MDDRVGAGPREVDAASPGLVESVWRYRFRVLAFVIVCGVAAYAISLLLPPRYEATAQMVLQAPEADSGDPGGGLTAYASAKRTSQQALYIRSTPVLAAAVEVLDGDQTVKDLRDAITVTAEPDIDTITLTGTAGSAEDAAGLVNAIVSSYREIIAGDARQTGSDAPASGDGVQFVEDAVAPVSPSSPRPLLNAIAAVLLAFLIAGPVSWARADRHRLVTEPRKATETLGAPLLGEIPRVRRNSPVLRNSSAIPSVAYDHAAVNLTRNVGFNVLLITSARRGDGKTVSALNLAAAFVRDGRRVVLVDADARERGLTQLLCGDPDLPGLTDLASGTGGQRDTRLELDVAGTRLTFVPSGGPCAEIGPLYRSAGMRRTMEQLAAEYDLVIVDTADLLASSDTVSLIDRGAAVVLVVRHGMPVRLLEKARHSLSMLRAPIGGVLYTFAAGRSSGKGSSRGSPTRTRAVRTADAGEPTVPGFDSRVVRSHQAVGRRRRAPWTLRPSKGVHP